MTEAADRRAGKAMGKMEETISGLQDDVAVANTPPTNDFKPWGLAILVLVVLLVSAATFFAVGKLVEVDVNTKAIDQGCEFRNEALALINEKFAQLNVLVEVSVKDADPTDPQTREFLAAFDKLRKPIPLQPCQPPTGP